MDDIINSQDAQEDCMVVAEEIIKKMARESRRSLLLEQQATQESVR
jgi:hypothetical protein